VPERVIAAIGTGLIAMPTTATSGSTFSANAKMKTPINTDPTSLEIAMPT
jgi:hypothetical protein